MSRRSGLGRGLGALIPSDLAGGGDGDLLRELALSSIEPNRYQPREHFDEAALVALSDSIRELGVLQPVLVRPIEGENDRFELIAGERRWRAARKAGLSHIPAIVRPVNDTSSLEQALVENLHRSDLNPLEEGAAYQQLMEEFGFTQEQVAARVGKSRSTVANTLRLLQLPTFTQRLVAEGQISAGHARALLGTPDRTLQDQLARRVVAENLSVRQIEEAVRQLTLVEATRTVDLVGESGLASAAPVGAEARGSVFDTPNSDLSSVGEQPEHDSTAEFLPPQVGISDANPRPVGSQPLPAAGLLELEQLLADLFETNVRISMGRGRGRLTIEFADIGDLERIYGLIVEGS